MNIHALMRGGLAALAVLFLCSGGFAQTDMLSTLENHEPAKTQTALPTKSAGSVATETVKPAASGDVFAKFFERINALFAKLNSLASRVNELMDRLAKAKARNAIPAKATSSSSPGSNSSSSSTAASSSGSGESAALNAWKGGKLSPEKFCALLGPVAAAS
ncbi:MAG TPA: hypothetical protein VIV61_18685, partial [Candidatus Ozemobacteraceae bacterium]